MKRTCEWCGVGIVAARADARFCSSQHRIYAHRAAKTNPIPRALLSRDRWIRRSASKVPLTVAGGIASSTDSSTWSSYAEAVASKAGVGLGFVLGDGIGCIDLDHCLNERGELTAAGRAYVADFPSNYIEVSPSGDGLHIWGLAPEVAGRRTSRDGLSVETYSTGRYITVTGKVFQRGELAPLPVW